MNNLNQIKSNFEGYQRFAELYNVNKETYFDDINISLSNWFSANMAAPLGCVLDLLESNVNTIKLNNISSSIQKILTKNEFLAYYGYPIEVDINNTTIKYLKLEKTDGKYFKNYITQYFLNRNEFIEIPEQLRYQLTESIYEIFVNAQTHSECSYIYSCGQFFPSLNKIEFCIVDNGVGFKYKVNNRFDWNLNSIEAIEWALKDRNTTKIGITGGIGLALLEEFICRNGGEFQIISYDGYYSKNSQGIITERYLNVPYPGTIINFKVNTNRINSNFSPVPNINEIF